MTKQEALRVARKFGMEERRRGEADPAEEYVPEEGGLWACMKCWDRFAAEDSAAQEAP